jgi:hypothetical protein
LLASKKEILITNDYPNQIDGNLRRYLPQAQISGGRHGFFVRPKVMESG